MKPERKFCSVTEVATVLNMSRTGVYGLIKRGEIPHIKVGQRILIPLQYLNDLDAMVASQTVPNKS